MTSFDELQSEMAAAFGRIRQERIDLGRIRSAIHKLLKRVEDVSYRPKSCPRKGLLREQWRLGYKAGLVQTMKAIDKIHK